jgi:hypothetical protein
MFSINHVHLLPLSCILHLFPSTIISLSASVNFVGHPGPHVPYDARVRQTVLYLELKMHSLKVALPTVKGKLHALPGSGPPTVTHLHGHPKIYLCCLNRFPRLEALVHVGHVIPHFKGYCYISDLSSIYLHIVFTTAKCAISCFISCYVFCLHICLHIDIAAY